MLPVREGSKSLFRSRKLEIKGTLPAILFIKTPRYTIALFAPNVVYLYELQMSIIKHFSEDFESSLN